MVIVSFSKKDNGFLEPVAARSQTLSSKSRFAANQSHLTNHRFSRNSNGHVFSRVHNFL